MGVAAIPLIMQGASTAMDLNSASAIERQGKLEAQMIDVAALQRETDRKSELVKSISSQRARAGASGITIEGSPLSVIQESIRQTEQDTERDKFNTSIAKQSAIYSAKLKSGALKTKAGLSLLQRGSTAITTAPVKDID